MQQGCERIFGWTTEEMIGYTKFSCYCCLHTLCVCVCVRVLCVSDTVYVCCEWYCVCACVVCEWYCVCACVVCERYLRCSPFYLFDHNLINRRLYSLSSTSWYQRRSRHYVPGKPAKQFLFPGQSRLNLLIQNRFAWADCIISTHVVKAG